MAEMVVLVVVVMVMVIVKVRLIDILFGVVLVIMK